MVERFKTPSAAILLLLSEKDGVKRVLLQRRQNTGFADGLWDFSCSGHVEHGESLSEAAVREAKEELGIIIGPEKVKFAALVHKYERERDLTYYNGYFICDEFDGVPRICESNKCSELRWFDFNGLPSDLIDDRKKVAEAISKGVHYIEYGWEK